MQCFNCQHYLMLQECKAFSGKPIPRKYFIDCEPHDKPIKGQTGDYVFTPIK